MSAAVEQRRVRLAEILKRNRILPIFLGSRKSAGVIIFSLSGGNF
jgi:ribosomal protein L39E